MLYFDTSFIVPYFCSEANSAAVETFIHRHAKAGLALSHWTAVEFHSAVGMKIRLGELPETAQTGVLSRFRRAVENHFEMRSVAATDYQLASDYLENWNLGLRSGDALHLAIAHHAGAAALCTLDSRMLKAAKHVGIPTRTIQ